MARSNEEARAELFEEYAANFGIHVAGHDGLFGCPLCFRVFGIEALRGGDDGSAPLLSIEHIPPEALGGRLKTLTCRECNSQHGSQLDAHLARRIQFEDSVSGISGEPIRARVQADAGTKVLAVDWYIRGQDERHFDISGVPKASHPDAPREIMESARTGQPMTLSFRTGFIPLRSRVALLRAAYLMMFRYFGYGYLRYGVAEVVRDQIMRYEADRVATEAVLELDGAPFPGEMNRLYAVHHPVELRCFLVALEVAGTRRRFFGVIMPGLDKESDEVYRRWAALGEEMRGLRLSPLQVPYDRRFLTDPARARVAMAVWAEVMRQAFGIVDGEAPLGVVVPGPVSPHLMYAPSPTRESAEVS